HELQGTLEMPVFQRGTRPYLTPEDGGDVELNGNTPVQQGTEPVCVSMTVPKGPQQPAEGWPLIIYAHGTGGTYRSHTTSNIAELLSTLDHNGTMAGAIVLGFDQVMHGSRAGDTDRSPESLYFNFTNPKAARGHLLQGTADLFYLVRLAENGWQLDAAESPTGEVIQIDPTRIYLLAHSQGSQYA